MLEFEHIAQKTPLAPFHHIEYNSLVMKNSSLIIHKSKLEMNIQCILSELPDGCSLIPVLKDNAFGLGINNIYPFFGNRFDMIAVSHVSEGTELRELGYTGELLLLGGLTFEMLPEALAADLTLSVFSPGFISILPKGTKVQLFFNTGLNRSGIEPDEIDAILDELKASSVCLTGAYSHEGSYELFLSLVKRLEDAGIYIPMKHYCDSAMFEKHPECALDAVRLGRRLYMDAPDNFNPDIEEAASWRAYVIEVRHRKKKDLLGYGGSFRLKADTDIALISIGYGDGLNLELVKQNAPVLINGRRCPILCTFMDQALVDVTGVSCQCGDEVTLFGYDRTGLLLPSRELAAMIDDEGVLLYSQISQRVERKISE